MLKRITLILVDKEPKKRAAKDKGKMEEGKGDLTTLEKKRGQTLHIT